MTQFDEVKSADMGPDTAAVGRSPRKVWLMAAPRSGTSPASTGA